MICRPGGHIAHTDGGRKYHTGILAAIQNPTEAMLAAQRICPQLQFVSIDVIGGLLEQTTPADVNNMSGHFLRKISHVDELLADEQLRVVGVKAGEEIVTLNSAVATNGIPVVTWLAAVFEMLRCTLKTLLLLAYASPEPLSQLAGLFPTCTVVLVCQLRFTDLVEKSLASTASRNHESLLSTVQAGLTETITDLTGALRQQQTTLLEMLMVVAVGHKNVTQQLIAAADVQSVDGQPDDHARRCLDQVECCWVQFVRHYLVKGSANPVLVKCCGTEIPYGEPNPNSWTTSFVPFMLTLPWF